MDHSAMGSAPGASLQPYDLQFIDTMIAHHQGAVDMAKLVETRAQHPELKLLGKLIINDQTKEIAQMKKWREEWFAGKTAAINTDLAGMRDGMKGMDIAKLTDLKQNPFDLEFIRQMILHHEGAVAMAKEALQKTEKPDIKALAENIIKSQEAEITKMREWQSIWAETQP